MEKAAEVGLVILDYEPGPNDLPAAFHNAGEILVATYSALFHGRSKFGVLGSGAEPVKVGAIICDDAYAAFSSVRDQVSISITHKNLPELYADLTTRLRADFEKIGKLGSFDDIVDAVGCRDLLSAVRVRDLCRTGPGF